MRAGVQRVFSSRIPSRQQGIGPSAGLLSGLNTVAQQEKAYSTYINDCAKILCSCLSTEN